MQSEKVNLPDTIGGWRLEGLPKSIDSKNIFEYMDGAGELYLGYHFDHLLAYEYKSENNNDILVELYFLKDSNDAFGLLSLDWGGEAVVFNRPTKAEDEKSIIPEARVLYGMGLLRLWSDNVYARVMAVKETAEAREAILMLGKIITSNCRKPSQPKMLQIIKPTVDSQWVLKKDRTAYFYSHLVLNSLYYLSHENILNLSHSTEAIMVTYERNQKDQVSLRVHLLVIKHPGHEQAVSALSGFIKVYLPEQKKEIKPEMNKEDQEFFQVEDGWMGYKLSNRYLALVFGCPDLKSAREILNQANLNKF